jgi:hypothetical protein
VDGESDTFFTGYDTASYLLINATNVGNTGELYVGNQGLMQITGQSVDLRDGAMGAGAITGGDGSDYTQGRGWTYTNNLYVNPSLVHDLVADVWTNSISLATYAREQPVDMFNVSTNGQFGHWVYAYRSGTNVYINIVYVRTNDMNTNLSVDVKFIYENYLYTTNDRYASEAIVRFGATGTDVITKSSFTNAFYLLDNGQAMTETILLTNILMDGGLRPSNFELTTSTPWEWNYANASTRRWSPRGKASMPPRLAPISNPLPVCFTAP